MMVRIQHKNENTEQIETFFLQEVTAQAEGFLFAFADKGIQLGVSEILTRWLTWDDLRRLVSVGMPDPCRYGVVVDGTLAETHDSESVARERQTHHREHGCEVTVIRLPVDPV